MVLFQSILFHCMRSEELIINTLVYSRTLLGIRFSFPAAGIISGHRVRVAVSVDGLYNVQLRDHFANVRLRGTFGFSAQIVRGLGERVGQCQRRRRRRRR